MIAPIRYRGPDEQGVRIEGPVGLGHVRLSIIDLRGGRQPMATADGTLWVTFNGEIFNYVELRQELLARGHRFQSRSDTEVILHAYREYGERCVEHFNGQWALAIWDVPRQRLLLARDRLGVRPLFHTTVGSRFLFGSEVKCLLADPDVPRAIDPRGLDELFTFWTPIAPRTVFAGIQELPPGHTLTVQNGRIDVRRYWQFDYHVEPGRADGGQRAEELLELLTASTQIRLRSDVPVGAYVSGGIDSAVTAALARRATGGLLHTFSIVFDDPEYDESVHQAEVVRHLDTQHQALHCTHADLGQAFPEVVYHTEKPLLRTAPAPLWLLSRLVRDAGYKVVLTGEGADEMLGGYDLFKESKVRRCWAGDPASRWRPALLGRLYPYMPRLQAQSPAYLQAFFRVSPADLAHRCFSHLPRWEMTSGIKRFFSPALRAELEGRDAVAELASQLPPEFGAWHPFCQAQYLESTILLPGYILSSQGDRMAMAHGVEGRFPFLDHRLVEWAAALPPRLKMRGLCEKYVLKRAARGLVPEGIVARSKQPYRAPECTSFFGTPEQPLRHDYVEELLDPERVTRDGLFDPVAVSHLVAKARAGRLAGVRDNMALVGILSTQILVGQFFREGVTGQAAAFDASSDWASATGNPALT